MKKIGLIVSFFTGAIVGSIMAARIVSKKAVEYYSSMINNNRLKLLYYQWLHLMADDIDICDILNKIGYRKVIVYGMGQTGELLCRYLSVGDEIKLVAVVDRAAKFISPKYPEYTMYTDENDLPDADCMIVTEPRFFDEISKAYKGRIKCDMISIEDILYPKGVE